MHIHTHDSYKITKKKKNISHIFRGCRYRHRKTPWSQKKNITFFVALVTEKLLFYLFILKLALVTEKKKPWRQKNIAKARAYLGKGTRDVCKE